MKAHYAAAAVLAAFGAIACGSDDTDLGSPTSGSGGATTTTGSAQGGGGTGTGGSPTSSSSTSATTSTTSTTSTGGTTGTGGTCASCGDVLQGADSATACTDNGPPSSSDLWTTFDQCVCVDNCGADCTDACAGGQPDAQCGQCIAGACSQEFQACTGDGGGGNCDTCSSVLTGQGDLGNLCERSQVILNDLVQCTCVDQCEQECLDSACAAMPPSQECQNCAATNCTAQLAACFMDM